MTKKELQIIKKAYKLLYKEFGQKKYKCDEYCIGCCQCAFTRFIEDFKSIIDEHLDYIK